LTHDSVVCLDTVHRANSIFKTIALVKQKQCKVKNC
ncbi:MAG: hypothetical protein ACI8VW_001953, partial [bacterium]